MAIDTENKRRSATGINSVFTIPPVADGVIDTQDRPHVGLIYSGIVISNALLTILGDDILSVTVFQDVRTVTVNQDGYRILASQNVYAVTVVPYGSSITVG